MSRSSHLAKNRLVAFFRWKHWKAALEVFVAISTIISMLLVYLTLREMQIARDNAYAPCLIIEDSKVNIRWDGSESAAQTKDEKNPLMSEGETENPLLVPFHVKNIGVGIARNVHMEINVENTMRGWVDLLNKELVNKSGVYPYKLKNDSGVLYFDNGCHPVGSNPIIVGEKLYLMANAADDLQCAFSPLMVLCINEFIINWKDELLSANPIRVYITYQDVQGKNLSTELFLYVDIDFLSRESDGSGYATYTIWAK